MGKSGGLHMGGEPGERLLHQIGGIVAISGAAREIAQKSGCLAAIGLRHDGDRKIVVRHKCRDGDGRLAPLNIKGLGISICRGSGGKGTRHETPGHAADSIMAPEHPGLNGLGASRTMQAHLF